MIRKLYDVWLESSGLHVQPVPPTVNPTLLFHVGNMLTNCGQFEMAKIKLALLMDSPLS